MTTQRRFPSDVPGNQSQSRIAIIRGTLSADLRNAYLIDFQGSVDGPETGYYSGPGTLATGARVRVLWSPDMGSWDIQGTTQSLGDKSSAELAVAAGGDDGQWTTPSGGYDNVGNEFTVQEIIGNFRHAFIRFDNVQIAQGATVQAGAFIRLSVHGGSNSTTINALIGAYDVDNGSAPVDKADCETQWSGRTIAETGWIEAISFTHDTVADTPDITAVLQEIVSRPGWVIGNAIVFLIRGQAGADHEHLFHAYEDPSSPAPVLHYTQAVPAAPALGTHDLLSLDHTDVDEDDTPADGEVLTWNDPPGEWAAEVVAGGHDEAHTVVSHSDTTATGEELDELTGGGTTGLHDHATAAADVTYTPTTEGDWTDPDPTDVEGALDDLAARTESGATAEQITKLMELFPDAFTIQTGSPVIGAVGSNSVAWQFGAAVTEEITISFTVPDDYVATSGDFSSIGNVLSTEALTTPKHHKHDGFSVTIISSYSAPGVNPMSITWTGFDVISSNDQGGLDKHFRQDGFSATIVSSYTTGGFDAAPRGITWDGVNVISVGVANDKHYLHQGFSSTITSSYSTPGAGPLGITWDGTNVISTDDPANKHYLHTGFSATISSSYSTTAFDGDRDMTWDGTDLMSTSNIKHFKHSGFSNTITSSYSFGSQAFGISWDGRYSDAISPGKIRIFYMMASATTGEVVWRVIVLSVAEGENYDAAGDTTDQADTVQGTAVNLGLVDILPLASPFAAGDRVRLTIGRVGGDGADTATGDAWLVGAHFRYQSA